MSENARDDSAHLRLAPSAKLPSNIAAKPDYQRVSISRDFANGAPVVEPGASVPANRKGRSEVVSTASGRKINAQYAVIEAADLLPSHDINGSQNADYENGAPGKSRAIAGNGRVTGTFTVPQRKN